MPTPDTEGFAPHQVPTYTDEQSFRVEVLRTLREVSRQVNHITERMHAGDLRLSEHDQRLEQQEATHQSEIVRLKDAHQALAARQEKLGDALQAEKGGYKHFMLKEIYEQPAAVRAERLPVEHRGGAVQPLRELQLGQLEQELRPLRRRRQVVARKRVAMPGDDHD